MYDLIDYNPEYQNLLRDTSKTGIAAVELEYNESAVSCCFSLWSTDYSYMDYETMYAYTAEYGQIVDKGDPATLIYVSFGATNTLCSIGIDADGNYGEMHTYYVTYTEDGRCMDFGLYDEYYAAALAGQTAVRMPFIMPETVSSTLLSVPAVLRRCAALNRVKVKKSYKMGAVLVSQPPFPYETFLCNGFLEQSER